MNLPVFTGFNVNGKLLFPTLFVTIACGAVSGFHSLVSSGTSSKQVRNEKDMLPISFGAMLVESVLAVVALVVGFVLSLGGYNNIWPLFGSTNQLLSALILITLSVFLKTTGRKGFMLWAPMCIMLVVTFTALAQAILNIIKKLFVTGGFVFMTDGLQLIFAILLVSLGFMVAFHCFGKLLGKGPEENVIE